MLFLSSYKKKQPPNPTAECKLEVEDQLWDHKHLGIQHDDSLNWFLVMMMMVKVFVLVRIFESMLLGYKSAMGPQKPSKSA